LITNVSESKQNIKIAVFTDTHLHDLHSGIPYFRAIMAKYAADAAMVLHAGDVGDPDLLLAFDGYPLHRVLGNTDAPCAGIGVQKVLSVAAYRIGLIHGWGGRHEIERKAREAFSDSRPDVIVYGHTHWPVCHHVAGQLMFNPGSCVERRRAPHYTFGILELGDTLTGRIVNVDTLAAQYLRG
jgi:uncharacterized protein